MIKGVGARTIDILTDHYTDFDTDFYNLQIVDFIKRGLGLQKAELLYYQLKNTELLTDELELLNKNNASFITPYESEYPHQLKNQEAYPSVLYQQKNTENININDFIGLSVVSSRETNSYGKKVIYKLFEELSEYKNIIIISGGAIGVTLIFMKQLY